MCTSIASLVKRRGSAGVVASTKRPWTKKREPIKAGVLGIWRIAK
jgi:hypothetical protein